MFSNVIPAKKKEVKIEDDDVLANILNELDSTDNQGAASNTATAQNSSSKSTKLVEKAEMKNFMADFGQSARKTEKPKVDSTSDDVSSSISLQLTSNIFY